MCTLVRRWSIGLKVWMAEIHCGFGRCTPIPFGVKFFRRCPDANAQPRPRGGTGRPATSSVGELLGGCPLKKRFWSTRVLTGVSAPPMWLWRCFFGRFRRFSSAGFPVDRLYRRKMYTGGRCAQEFFSVIPIETPSGSERVITVSNFGNLYGVESAWSPRPVETTPETQHCF